jgi:hypothetical protein
VYELAINHYEHTTIRLFESIYWGEIDKRDAIGSEIWDSLELEEAANMLAIPRRNFTQEFSICVWYEDSRYLLIVWHDPDRAAGAWRFMYALNPYEALPK